MNLKQKYGRTALVAGASEGIGAAFATYLAAEGMDLVLIARRPQPLKELGDRLEEKYKVSVICIPCDLSDINTMQQMEEAIDGKEINLLVYNAAMSYIGPFIKNSPENHSRMARVNMLTPLSMIHVFGERMLAHKTRGNCFDDFTCRAPGKRILNSLCSDQKLLTGYWRRVYGLNGKTVV